MIVLKNVCKNYSTNRNTFNVLKNVSINLENKGMTFILGKSGSGKSTLLNIIGGLDKFDNGDIIVDGKNIKNFSEHDFDLYRNTYVGFIFQNYNLIDTYNVYENILISMQLRGSSISENKIDDLLKKLEIYNLKYRKISELSGGEQQRVAIARALVKNPKVILADEPTGNLDTKTASEVMKLLKEISKDRLVVVVSHDTNLAKSYGDRIISLEDGKVIDDTKPLKTCKDSNIYTTFKSMLSFKDGFKLGITTLKYKKIKLLFTIILTIFSLLFLSLIDTLSSYNVSSSHAKLLEDSHENFVQIEKYKYNSEYKYDYFNKTELALNEDDIKNIKSNVKSKMYPVYKVRNSEVSFYQIPALLNINDTDIIFRPSYYNIVGYGEIVVANNIKDVVKEEIIGREIINNNEIIISNYVADLIIYSGISMYNNDEIINYKPNSYSEILNTNNTYFFGKYGKVKIVGIINYDNSDYEMYKSKKFVDFSNDDNMINAYDKLGMKIKNVYNKIYVNDKFIDNLKYDNIYTLNETNTYEVVSNVLTNNLSVKQAVIEDNVLYYDGNDFKKINKLSSNEVLIDISMIKGFDTKNYMVNLNSYLSKYKSKDKLSLEEKFFKNYIKDYNVISNNMNLIINSDIKYDNLKIIGITGFRSNSVHYNYYSWELVSKFKTNTIELTSYLIPMSSYKDFKSIINMYPYDSELAVKSTYSDNIIMLVNTIYKVRDIAFYVGIVFLIFTITLISNFIATSIEYRKKDIGILRAMGARSVDAIKIFIWEGLFIALVSATISSILLVFISKYLNVVMISSSISTVSPFIIGKRQLLMIYLLVFIVVIVSSVIPIRKISLLRPIDAIKK